MTYTHNSVYVGTGYTRLELLFLKMKEVEKGNVRVAVTVLDSQPMRQTN